MFRCHRKQNENEVGYRNKDYIIVSGKVYRESENFFALLWNTRKTCWRPYTRFKTRSSFTLFPPWLSALIKSSFAAISKFSRVEDTLPILKILAIIETGWWNIARREWQTHNREWKVVSLVIKLNIDMTIDVFKIEVKEVNRFSWAFKIKLEFCRISTPRNIWGYLKIKRS